MVERAKGSRSNGMLERARELRRNMTPEERQLWYRFLRDYPIKIYKQRIIDRFIVDFYCPKAKLVIELDGSQHYTVDGMTYDGIRTDILEQYELEVIRFSNLDINENFDGVCTSIDMAMKQRRVDYRNQENADDF